VALCRNLEVSKAGYYAWRERMPSVREQADDALRPKISAIHRKSRGSYGSPSIHAELKAGGLEIGRKRVARLMKLEQIQGKKRQQFRTTTDSSHGYPVAANLLDRRFSTDAPDVVWAADITYFSTWEGWLYLAVVLDLFSRRVIGWAMSQWIDAALAIDALRMAVDGRRPKPGLIVHTDRGSQYACNEYRAFIEARGIVPSMSRKRDCWDNAVVESFFASLKLELKPDRPWSTRCEARTAIFEYIAAWYNRERRHSTLGYISPTEFEERRCVA
jgi:putative transposase